MVKTSSDTFWHNKIQQFKNQNNASLSECSGFLLDLLQGLFTEIADSTKLELLIVLQEHSEALIQNQESAEQATGSILSLLENIQDKNEKHYVGNLLITATAIVIEFDLKEFNPRLVNDLLQTLMKLAKNINQPGYAVIRKTACDCMLELERYHPTILSKFLNELYILSAREKTFAAQAYLVLFSTVLLNFLQDKTKEKELVRDTSSDFPVANILEKKGKEMASYISEDYNLLSPVAKWHVGQKIPHIFHEFNMPTSILTTKLVFECSQSFDLHTLHQGVSLSLSSQENQRSIHDIKTVALSLLRSISMPNLPRGFKCVCLKWFLELLQPLRDLALEASEFAREAITSLTPTIFDETDVMRRKLEVITEMSVMFKDIDINLMNLLIVPLKSADYGAMGTKLTTLYHVFYLNFVKTEQSLTRQDIADQILTLTVENPEIIEYTVDFIAAIRNDLHEPVGLDLICKIGEYILNLDFKKFIVHCNNYLIFMEHVCCEKELWPMDIVKWLKRFCINTDICRQGNWLTGSNILLVCRSILRTHTSVLLLQDLADLLWLLHQKYQHDDIKDRALFYYLTIGHASPQHYTRLFASTEAEHKMQAMNKRPEIEIPSDLMQGVLPTLRFDTEFLELTKMAKHKVNRISNNSEIVYQDISSYHKILKSESFDRNVYIKLNLQHNKDTTEDIPNKIFALTIKFSSQGPYNEIPELHLPYLSKFKKPDQSSKGEMVILKFEPKQPVPASISVTAVFSNSASRTCIAPMKSLELEFSDFFNPLSCIDPHQLDEQKLKILFEILWVYFGENQRTSSNRNKFCAESVKRLAISEQKMKNVLQNDLQSYLIEKINGVAKYGIFLPPYYCILLVFEITAEETLVRWRLDNWELLGLTEDYLESLCVNNSSEINC